MLQFCLALVLPFLPNRCKCGNCSREHLSNAHECVCCMEIDECQQALNSELVIFDVGQNANLKCITEHPGFNTICLQRWSLRMSSDRYKTKHNAKYTQKDSEGRLEIFLVHRGKPALGSTGSIWV